MRDESGHVPRQERLRWADGSSEKHPERVGSLVTDGLQERNRHLRPQLLAGLRPASASEELPLSKLVSARQPCIRPEGMLTPTSATLFGSSSKAEPPTGGEAGKTHCSVWAAVSTSGTQTTPNFPAYKKSDSGSRSLA